MKAAGQQGKSAYPGYAIPTHQALPIIVIYNLLSGFASLQSIWCPTIFPHSKCHYIYIFRVFSRNHHPTFLWLVLTQQEHDWAHFKNTSQWLYFPRGRVEPSIRANTALINFVLVHVFVCVCVCVCLVCWCLFSVTEGTHVSVSVATRSCSMSGQVGRLMRWSEGNPKLIYYRFNK